jgi:hypothetical protein
MKMGLIWRWGIITILSLIGLFVSEGIVFNSIYSAVMVVLVLGLGNALLPFIVRAADAGVSILSVFTASMVGSSVLLYFFGKYHIGIVTNTYQSTVLGGVVVAVFTLIATLATENSLIMRKNK